MAGRTQQEIEQWIVERIRSRLGDEEIDVDAPLMGYGLDSMQVVALATELEEYLGFRFNENPLLDHPTIDALSQHLARVSHQPH